MRPSLVFEAGSFEPNVLRQNVCEGVVLTNATGNLCSSEARRDGWVVHPERYCPFYFIFISNDYKEATWVDLAVASGLMPTTSSVSYLHNQTPKESFESFSIRLFVSMVTDRIIRNCSGHLR